MTTEVGQKIYIDAGNDQFYPGEVSKITPKGMTDVKWGADRNVVTRFRADGRRLGDTSWRAIRIDAEMSFDERTKWLEDLEHRRTIVRAYINLEIPTLSRWNGTPDWHSIRETIAELRAKVQSVYELANG